MVSKASISAQQGDLDNFIHPFGRFPQETEAPCQTISLREPPKRMNKVVPLFANASWCHTHAALFRFRAQQTRHRGRSAPKCGYISREKTTIRSLTPLAKFPFHQMELPPVCRNIWPHSNSFAGISCVDTLLLSDVSETNSNRANIWEYVGRQVNDLHSWVCSSMQGYLRYKIIMIYVCYAT